MIDKWTGVNDFHIPTDDNDDDDSKKGNPDDVVIAVV